MPDRVGFIGLGIMGSGMTHNLLRASVDLTVYNRTPERMQPLADAGAATAASPTGLAATTDVVFVCVSDTPDVEAVLLGPEGVIHGARPGSLVVDMSTISPRATRRMAERLAEARERLSGIFFFMIQPPPGASRLPSAPPLPAPDGPSAAASRTRPSRAG